MCTSFPTDTSTHNYSVYCPCPEGLSASVVVAQVSFLSWTAVCCCFSGFAVSIYCSAPPVLTLDVKCICALFFLKRADAFLISEIGMPERFLNAQTGPVQSQGTAHISPDLIKRLNRTLRHTARCVILVVEQGQWG